jgi:hypothetical protein
MLALTMIDPPGKLQSTVIGLKMFYIHHPHQMDITDNVRLGGAFSTFLLGPTPAELVPPGMNPQPQRPDPNTFVRPANTRASAASDNHRNWLE